MSEILRERDAWRDDIARLVDTFFVLQEGGTHEANPHVADFDYNLKSAKLSLSAKHNQDSADVEYALATEFAVRHFMLNDPGLSNE